MPCNVRQARCSPAVALEHRAVAKASLLYLLSYKQVPPAGTVHGKLVVQCCIPSTLQNSKATALTSARRASAAAQGSSCARSTGRSPGSSPQSYTSWQVGTHGADLVCTIHQELSKQRALACNTVDEGTLTRTRKGAASAGSSARTAGSGTGGLLLSRHALMP